MNAYDYLVSQAPRSTTPVAEMQARDAWNQVGYFSEQVEGDMQDLLDAVAREHDFRHEWYQAARWFEDGGIEQSRRLRVLDRVSRQWNEQMARLTRYRAQWMPF